MISTLLLWLIFIYTVIEEVQAQYCLCTTNSSTCIDGSCELTNQNQCYKLSVIDVSASPIVSKIVDEYGCEMIDLYDEHGRNSSRQFIYTINGVYKAKLACKFDKCTENAQMADKLHPCAVHMPSNNFELLKHVPNLECACNQAGMSAFRSDPDENCTDNVLQMNVDVKIGKHFKCSRTVIRNEPVQLWYGGCENVEMFNKRVTYDKHGQAVMVKSYCSYSPLCNQDETDEHTVCSLLFNTTRLPNVEENIWIAVGVLSMTCTCILISVLIMCYLIVHSRRKKLVLPVDCVCREEILSANAKDQRKKSSKEKKCKAKVPAERQLLSEKPFFV